MSCLSSLPLAKVRSPPDVARSLAARAARRPRPRPRRSRACRATGYPIRSSSREDIRWLVGDGLSHRRSLPHSGRGCTACGAGLTLGDSRRRPLRLPPCAGRYLAQMGSLAARRALSSCSSATTRLLRGPQSPPRSRDPTRTRRTEFRKGTGPPLASVSARPCRVPSIGCAAPLQNRLPASSLTVSVIRHPGSDRPPSSPSFRRARLYVRLLRWRRPRGRPLPDRPPGAGPSAHIRRRCLVIVHRFVTTSGGWVWCRGWGSNPHGPHGPRDFKSRVSTSSTTSASAAPSTTRL